MANENSTVEQAQSTVTFSEPLVSPSQPYYANIGVPGNIKKLTLEGESHTVADLLRRAEIDATGYDMRVSGQPVQLETLVPTGQTVLLLRPVVGNLTAEAETQNVKVNAGVPGNLRKITLEPGRDWTVNEVLRRAEIDATGYDIRVAGQPVESTTPVIDGQTILLLRPVTGN